MSAFCGCICRPFVIILDFCDEKVKNKPKTLRNCYAVMLFLSVIFWLTSFRVMSQCFYHPCIEGWGLHELNKMHYGLTYHMMQTEILLSLQAIFGIIWFHRENAEARLTSPVYSFLLGAMFMSIWICLTTYIMYEAYAWIIFNLKITGDVLTFPSNNEDEVDHDQTSSVTDLEPALRVMSSFAAALTLVSVLLFPNMLWWGHKEDERQLSSFYISPGDTYQSTSAKSNTLEGEF
mmetsp:Transcript_27743/g.60648  ORF Transcript_27743/g.60648 Transcript_27743/m.60648 type:complete len:234 (-) Transcript_27743:2062-2763(-)